jgi:hypothetical protein
LCWYHAGWDKTDYVSIDTISDEDGCFSAKFEKGYKVVVASVAPKYYPNLRESEEFGTHNIGINLVLTKKMDTVEAGEAKINLRYFIVQNSGN